MDTTKTGKKIFLASLAVAAVACGDSNEPAGPVIPDKPSGDKAASMVIYQVNPRFYGESDCLKAVTDDISRIADMGCDVIWLMPIYEIGVKNSIGSPYCVKDYKSVAASLGTMEDLKELVSVAHGKGLDVILDWVANHTSWDNTWTITNPERYANDANGNIAATPSWGDVAQLDYSVESTRTGMKEAMKFWIEQADIDGFRCDYAEGVPHSFWKEAITELRAEDPDVIMLAESSRTDFYADGFDMVYDWNFAPAMKTLFNGGKPAAFHDYVTGSNAKIPSGKTILRYAFNHDVAAENEVDRMFGAPEGVPAAYVLAAMSNSTPMIYSSMDVEGLKGKLSFFNHRKLDFSPELTATYKAINNAFKVSAEARGGELKNYAQNEAVVFSRENGGKTLLVMVNPSAKAISVKTPISFTGMQVSELISGEKTSLPVMTDIPAYGYKIYLGDTQ